MSQLFIAPSPIEGFVFINNAGESFLLTNDEFSPTDIDHNGLDQVNFGIEVQVTVDNAQLKLDEIKAEIQTAIENFE